MPKLVEVEKDWLGFLACLGESEMSLVKKG